MLWSGSRALWCHPCALVQRWTARRGGGCWFWLPPSNPEAAVPIDASGPPAYPGQSVAAAEFPQGRFAAGSAAACALANHPPFSGAAARPPYGSAAAGRRCLRCTCGWLPPQAPAAPKKPRYGSPKAFRGARPSASPLQPPYGSRSRQHGALPGVIWPGPGRRHVARPKHGAPPPSQPDPPPKAPDRGC